ncbi:probable glucuronoxylan glucuronosyltransferase IRX7 [Andrographis paniculata]|uniref:probable glucuronoxylan glucuronosyltransferase IRX7 n=1 Tax=Andrographis paniculata TaxID=175694 RepID=UPI0021E860A5|nr:probable glucuronoxylan glucuronosyltransferase IRX7 [Andrographis paniculata]
MPEIQRPVKTRGFYVRMKLSNGGQRHTRNSAKQFCYRYSKWILWFSISLYFLSSFFNKPSPSFSRTILRHSAASRVLIEESYYNSTSSLRFPMNGMKVYVYDLPPEYNAAWLSDRRCSRHLFAAEVAIHRALSSSEFRTLNPLDADFFFVPVYVSCNFSKVNGFPAIGHARALMAAAVRHVSERFPFWNRSGGADHVFVASHDFGSCFHTMEDAAAAEGVPEFLKNSIVLQTFGVEDKHPCQNVEHVVIPPYVSPESVRTTLEKTALNGRRDIFAFFRGKMEVHPKNVSGRYYSKRVRTMIWQRYGGDRRFYLRRRRFAGYQSEIVRSKFCLCPLGWAPWSPRLVESVALGCVPVIIADGIRLPFPAAVPWAEISLTVAERDVGRLGKVLDHVAATNLTVIQRNLRDPEVRKALMFNDPMVKGDATWQVLVALSAKLDRSHKRLSSE